MSESYLSFRTERSVVKNLGGIHLCVLEILRFALDDNSKIQKTSETTNKTIHFLVSIFLKIRTKTDKFGH